MAVLAVAAALTVLLTTLDLRPRAAIGEQALLLEAGGGACNEAVVPEPGPGHTLADEPAVREPAIDKSLGEQGGASSVALKAGAAAVKITPARPGPLGGFGARRNRPFSSVRDEPVARALVLDTGRPHGALTIVNIDLVAVPPALAQTVEAQVREAYAEIGTVLVTATHTHNGPGGLWDSVLASFAGMGRFDATYFDFVVDSVLEAVKRAWEDRLPARVTVFEGEGPPVCRNPHEGRIPDRRLTIVRIDRPSSEILARLVVFPCHPTFLGRRDDRLSGEWPGELDTLLDGITLTLQGAVGDMRPSRFDHAKFGLSLSERDEALVEPELRMVLAARMLAQTVRTLEETASSSGASRHSPTETGGHPRDLLPSPRLKYEHKEESTNLSRSPSHAPSSSSAFALDSEPGAEPDDSCVAARAQISLEFPPPGWRQDPVFGVAPPSQTGRLCSLVAPSIRAIGAQPSSVRQTDRRSRVSWQSALVPLYPATGDTLAPRGLRTLTGNFLGRIVDREARVTVLAIGDQGFMFVPGEVVTPLALQWEEDLREIAGLRAARVVSLTGGHLGYFEVPEALSERTQESKGAWFDAQSVDRLTQGFSTASHALSRE